MRRPSLPSPRRLAAAVLCAAGLAGAAAAQDMPTRSHVWDLKIGAPAAAQPGDFIDFACGTNGGPPSTPLKGFADFQRCKPDRNGLREVYFRYDDELEYWARARRDQLLIRRYRGTQVFDFPVVASALFDEAGILKGIQLVTDPRDESRDRIELWALANFLRNNFGGPGWTCADLPTAPGESPVGTRYIKQRCEKAYEGKRLVLENRFYRRPGQTGVNPTTNAVVMDEFESSTRFNMLSPDVAWQAD